MWANSGKSVIGTAHQKIGLPCQDYCGAAVLEMPRRLLLAISDGAGFAKYADEAARLAVECALEKMAAFAGSVADISGNEVSDWLSCVKGCLQAEADRLKENLADFSCTLLGAIIEGDTGHFWQIGDGGWIVQTDRGIEVATWPFSGEFINETVFVTSSSASEKWVCASMKPVNAVLGFTDGLEHLILDFPKQKVHKPFAEKLFRSLGADVLPSDIESQISAFLSSQLINDRTDDDKTMVLAWLKPTPTDVDRRNEPQD